MATIEKRTSKAGITSYRVKVRIRGELPRTRTFARRKDADAWAASVRTDLTRGEHVPTTGDRQTTLAHLIDRYVAEYLPVKGGAHKGVGVMLRWWRDHYGHATLDKLQPSLFIQARAKLMKRTKADGQSVSGATVNRYLAAMSAVCKWAWKELQLLHRNPVLSVSKLKEGQGVTRFLSDDERRALLAACRAHPNRNIYAAVVLALATGLRYSNVRELTWENVDRDTWTLNIHETKNGEPRRVPIVGSAQRALAAQFDADPTGKGWVFKGAKDSAPEAFNGKVWRSVRDAAGLQDFRFHDLRHTTGSYLTQEGAGLAQVADALGHRTLAMAKRYSHQSGEHVRATLSSIARRLDAE